MCWVGEGPCWWRLGCRVHPLTFPDRFSGSGVESYVGLFTPQLSFLLFKSALVTSVSCLALTSKSRRRNRLLVLAVFICGAWKVGLLQTLLLFFKRGFDLLIFWKGILLFKTLWFNSLPFTGTCKEVASWSGQGREFGDFAAVLEKLAVAACSSEFLNSYYSFL